MNMKTEDALREFGDALALANALGITRAAIYQWGETVPPLRAYQIRDVIAKRQAEAGEKQAA
jgi:DNA-binding transcriptional regulator YdaS (Cro superfamily)